MKTQPLSPATRSRLDALFAPSKRQVAEQLLVERCGNNLPFLQDLDQFELERFRFAALRLSEGRLKDLERAIDLANTDWRDLLMAAGFGEDVKEHGRWWPPGMRENPPMQRTGAAGILSRIGKWLGRGPGR